MLQVIRLLYQVIQPFTNHILIGLEVGIVLFSPLFHPIIISAGTSQQIHLIVTPYHTFLHYPLLCGPHKFYGTFMLAALPVFTGFVLPTLLLSLQFTHGIDYNMNMNITGTIMVWFLF
jgi:hypothetical protein